MLWKLHPMLEIQHGSSRVSVDRNLNDVRIRERDHAFDC
jgi:hypothetical protein